MSVLLGRGRLIGLCCRFGDGVACCEGGVKRSPSRFMAKGGLIGYGTKNVKIKKLTSALHCKNS